MRPPVVVLNGPTASGKSALAVEVAVLLRGRGVPAEIVNADAMLVYRGMDIGTAKPTHAERASVPHHLLDFLDVTRTASVAEFQALAREAIERLRWGGVLPVLVGGSALYVHAIVDDFAFPGTDAEVRARLERELAQTGAVALYERLRTLAPEVAAGILPGNGRRIVRALEVLELTGSFRSVLPQWRYALDDVHQFGLDIDRAVLDAAIADRVHAMVAAGWLDEVRTLAAAGLREGKTASRALGYRQLLAHLDGEMTLDEAIADTIRGTKRFARKQLGWFRRDPRIAWLPAGDPDNAARIVAAVLPGLDSAAQAGVE